MVSQSAAGTPFLQSASRQVGASAYPQRPPFVAHSPALSETSGLGMTIPFVSARAETCCSAICARNLAAQKRAEIHRF